MNHDQLISSVSTLQGSGPKFPEAITKRPGARYNHNGFGPDTDKGHPTVCGGCRKKPEHPCALVFEGALRNPVCPTEAVDMPDANPYGYYHTRCSDTDGTSYTSSVPEAPLMNSNKSCPPHGFLFYNNSELESLTVVALSDHGHPKLWAKPCHDLARAGDSLRITDSEDCEIFGIYTILDKEKMTKGVKLTLSLVQASGSLGEKSKLFVRYGDPLGQELDAPMASDGTYGFDDFTTSNLVNIESLEFSNSSIYSFAGRVREIQVHFQATVTVVGPVGFDLEIPISMSGYTGVVLTSGSAQTDSASQVVAVTGRVHDTTTLRVRWVAGETDTYFGRIGGSWKTLLLG